MMVSSSFYLSACRMLTNEHFTRVMINCGVSQMQMDAFRGKNLWTADQRIQMRVTLDAVVYGLCDMAQLPRVDVPAELVAAVIAMTVDPGNWMICASWQSGLKSARDLAEPEETVEIERVSAGRMLSLILHADAAMRDHNDYQAVAQKVQSKFAVKEVMING